MINIMKYVKDIYITRMSFTFINLEFVNNFGFINLDYYILLSSLFQCSTSFLVSIHNFFINSYRNTKMVSIGKK